jgi:hypothetical protein
MDTILIIEEKKNIIKKKNHSPSIFFIPYPALFQSKKYSFPFCRFEYPKVSESCPDISDAMLKAFALDENGTLTSIEVMKII